MKDAIERNRSRDALHQGRNEPYAAIRWHRARRSSDGRTGQGETPEGEKTTIRQEAADKTAGHRITDRQRPQHDDACHEPPEERRARAEILRRTDADILERVRARYGRSIDPGRLAQAERTHAELQRHDGYQRGLREAYPDLKPEERRRILGDLRDGSRPHVDAQDYRLRTTLAHERLHQVAHPKFRAEFGRGLTEGLTEHYAREIAHPVPIKDAPECYPREHRLVEMMHAEVNPETFRRAYFQGDTESLKREIDARFGSHAADRAAALTDLGKTYTEAYGEAEEVLKDGYLRNRRRPVGQIGG